MWINRDEWVSVQRRLKALEDDKITNKIYLDDEKPAAPMSQLDRHRMLSFSSAPIPSDRYDHLHQVVVELARVVGLRHRPAVPGTPAKIVCVKKESL